jgi:hypothetical protein
MKFNTIKDIDINNPSSWQDYCFITSYLDWCHDDVLLYSVELFRRYDVPVTFFVTHATDLISEMLKCESFELGIHPNFNKILNNDICYGKNIEEVVDYYIKIVPNSVSVRSHCVVQSSRILSVFSQYGLKYDCNTYIPYESNIILQPWRHDEMLIKVPYFWADDGAVSHENVNTKFSFHGQPGLKCFSFHPIHLYLNTDSLDRYNSARPYFQDMKKLKYFVNKENFGVKDYFVELVHLLRSSCSVDDNVSLEK